MSTLKERKKEKKSFVFLPYNVQVLKKIIFDYNGIYLLYLITEKKINKKGIIKINPTPGMLQYFILVF